MIFAKAQRTLRLSSIPPPRPGTRGVLMRFRAVYALLSFLTAASLISCAAPGKDKAGEAAEKAYAGKYPRVVAVLPFANDTEEIGLGGQVRKSFYNHFSSKPYRDIEPSAVDGSVSVLEKSSGKPVFEMPPRDIADATGAEGVIYGRVTGFSRVYALAYSRLGVEAEVWLVDARTGNEVWRIKEDATYHEGGVPLTPIGAVMTMVTTALNIREMQRIRVINEIGWKINEKVPSPPELKFEDRPVIKNVISNAREGPFGKGKTFRVAMEGEKGLFGLFEMAGFKKALPMKEVSPGEYLGEYLVIPGDNAREAPVIVYLRRPGEGGGGGGDEAEWLDISGFVTIDTIPPPSPEGLKARGFYDRVELTWKGVAAPDLLGYRVMRSRKPLSLYEEAGFTEEPAFTDKDIAQKEIYYYRVSSVDAAGNSGDPAREVKVTLRESETRELPSRIERDLTLFPGSYLVRGDTVAEAGVTLTVMPDAKLLFDKGSSLTVRGTLASEGEKDALIEYVPAEAGRKEAGFYKGVFIDGGAASIRHVRMSGAEKALVLKNSGASISDSVIENNRVGVSTEGIPSPAIAGTTVWHNGTGVEVKGSRAFLKRNEITQNGIGLSVSDSTPEALENNIYGNGLNAEMKGPPPALDNNYFGSINLDEMRLKGDARIAKALDSPYPAGKPVDVIMNPYASLTPDERKAKTAELLLGAGKYFRERNFGRAATLFEESLKAEESPTAYYYLGLTYKGMDDNDRALEHLKKGSEKFPMDSNILKSYGLLLYQLNMEGPARETLKEALRLNPGDKQIRFVLERLESK